jgi:hypothetical protein
MRDKWKGTVNSITSYSTRKIGQIIHSIDTAFGQSLDDKNATSIVNAAWAIKYGLTRPNYKAADEP